MRLPRSIVLGAPWPAPGEPLFTTEDTDLALAWQRDLDLTCPGCGQNLEESTHPDAVEDYDATSEVCFGCAAKAFERRRFTADGSAQDSLDGRYFIVHRLPEEAP